MFCSGDTIEGIDHPSLDEGCRKEGIRMRTFVVALPALMGGSLVGFVLLDLVGILLSGHAAEVGIGRILVRLTLVCVGIALVVAILRRWASQPSRRRSQRSKP